MRKGRRIGGRGPPTRGGVWGEVETGERVDKGQSLVAGLTPAAWKPAPAFGSRRRGHLSGVAHRDPRHKPTQRGSSQPLGPGARLTHRLRSRPPLLCVGLSTGSQLLLAGVQAAVARAGRRTRGSAAPPAGTARSLPSSKHSGRPGAPPPGDRAGPAGCGDPHPGAWNRTRPRSVQTAIRTRLRSRRPGRGKHPHSERTGPVLLPTLDLGPGRVPWPRTRP